MDLKIDAAGGEKQLDALIKAVETSAGRCLWVVGPNSQPRNLKELLVERNFKPVLEWDGLILTDLTIKIPVNPVITVEKLSEDNVEDYARTCTDSNDDRFKAYLLETAQRFLQIPAPEIEIFIARMEGKVAGYGVLRVESNGTAYLRNALTVAEFRRRGVYKTLTAYRIELAKSRGCERVVIQANAETSSPILQKYKFLPICRFTGLLPGKV